MTEASLKKTIIIMQWTTDNRTNRIAALTLKTSRYFLCSKFSVRSDIGATTSVVWTVVVAIVAGGSVAGSHQLRSRDRCHRLKTNRTEHQYEDIPMIMYLILSYCPGYNFVWMLLRNVNCARENS